VNDKDWIEQDAAHGRTHRHSPSAPPGSLSMHYAGKRTPAVRYELPVELISAAVRRVVTAEKPTGREAGRRFCG